MRTNISSKTKNTSIIVTLATMLVLSGTAAMLSPTQAFAGEEKKEEPKKKGRGAQTTRVFECMDRESVW
jgi:ribose/xylose/arabinose/galactoside ABC-type transport system permease subunit